MRYIVTSPPTWDSGRPNEDFSEGDVVEVTNSTPDSDGDVLALNVTRGAVDREYVALSCLTPEDAIRKPKGATITVDVVPNLDLTGFAETVAAALAFQLRELADRIEGKA